MQVSCEKCQAEYQIDERRLPPAGLKMRCPKCAHTFVVKRAEGAGASTPTPAAVPRPVVPPAPRPPAAAKSQSGELDFGDLDLPVPSTRAAAPSWGSGRVGTAPAEPPAASPMEGSSAFGELDLPAPAAGKRPPAWQSPPRPSAPLGELDLPTPSTRGAPGRTGEIAAKFPAAAAVVQSLGAELPALKEGSAPPSSKQSLFDLDLPAVRGKPATPAAPAKSPSGFGELDLPVPAASAVVEPRAPLPSQVELPAPKGRAKGSVFDELDLPIPTSGELPVPKPASPVERARAQTVLGTGSLGSSGAELPVPREVPLPAPMGLPGVMMPSAEAQARAAGKRAQIVDPSLDLSDDLPLPKRDEDLPVPMEYASGLTDLPIAKGDDELPVPRRSAAPASPDYGELDLASEGDSLEFGLEQPSAGHGASRGMMGEDDGSLDLHAPQGMMGGAQLETADVVVARGTRADTIPVAPKERARRRQRSRVGQIVTICALTFVILIGVGLNWTPLGPFGATFIAEHLPRAGQAELGATYIRNTRAFLKSDDFGSYRQAVAELRTGRGRAPRDNDLKAYAAHVQFLRVVRYGPDSRSERRGGQLLATMDVESTDSNVVKLAAAAREVARNQLPRAVQRLQALVQSSPRDTDALSLLGWTQLLRGEVGPAEATYTRLLAAEPGSGRAHYGLVRVAVLRNDLPVVRARIAAALAASPNHVGIVLEQARLFWSADRQAAPAIERAQEILQRRSNMASPGEEAAAHALIGLIAFSQDRYTDARTHFAAAIQLDERLASAHVGLGQVVYKQGDFAAALSSFQTAKRMDPDDVDAAIGAAMSMIELDRLVEAKALLQPLSEQRDSDPRIHYWLGKTLVEINDVEGAEREFRAALQARTDFTEASIALAALLSRTGKAEEANRLLEEARAHAPDTAMAHTALGQGYLERRDLESAEREFRRALTLQQEYVPARFLLGSVLRRRGQVDEARVNLEQVAQRDAGYPGLSLERGLLYESAGDASQALTMYRVALRAAPNDVDLKLRVGATAMLTGEYDEAKRVLDEVLQARPNSAEALYGLGRVRFARQDYVEASSAFQRAVDLDSSVAAYHLYFGWVSDVTNNLIRAQDELDQAIALDPTLAEAFWRRGLIRLRSGAPRDARMDLDKAIVLDAELYAAYAALGDALDQLRDLPGAVSAYRQAISHSAAVPQWHYRLGMLLLDVGDPRGAATALDQAVLLGAAETPRPAWLPDAYRNQGTALAQSGQRGRAVEALRKFLEIAPPGAMDRSEVRRELDDLGAQ